MLEFIYTFDMLNPLFLQLAWTCYNFYQSTPTKLAGENYFFNSDQVFFIYFYFSFLIVLTTLLAFFTWIFVIWFLILIVYHGITSPGSECGNIMEHIETRDSWIAFLSLASNWKQDIPRMGLEYLSGIWKKFSHRVWLCWIERCKYISNLKFMYSVLNAVYTRECFRS